LKICLTKHFSVLHNREIGEIGYEINFTKHFYEFKPLRSLADIKADILALEQGTVEQGTVELEKKVLD